jgi:hypothetical protein
MGSDGISPYLEGAEGRISLNWIIVYPLTGDALYDLEILSLVFSL